MTTTTLDITKQVILAQLQENTGRHMLDSGGAYGRNWERNQGKTWDDFTKDPVRLEAHVYTYGDVPKLELLGTISLAAWMENNLTYNAELQAAYDAFCKRVDPDNDDYDMSLMMQFADHHDPKHSGIRYTYNEDNCLSQDVQLIEFKFEVDGYEEQCALVQVHGGCDARGGLTSPKAYTLREGGLPLRHRDQWLWL
jgi:hypothetical protein